MKKFLAIYTGKPMPEGTPPPDQATIAKGMAAWGKWMEDHTGAIVDAGGPLGKTKEASPKGIADIRNAMVGYIIVKADSHDAAVKMFENHPSFSIFPGESVEVMECMPIPTA